MSAFEQAQSGPVHFEKLSYPLFQSNGDEKFQDM